MTSLTINRFSCLEHAHVDLSDLTVLIGPQAAGKSVISKLLYFFYDVVDTMHMPAEEGDGLKQFIQGMGERFKVWFPSSAWGPHKFSITFTGGAVTIIVSRKRASSGLSDKVSIEISNELRAHYERLADSFQDMRSKRDEQRAMDRTLSRDWELSYRIRAEAEQQLALQMGESAIAGQTFIPAGRSFFTSVGKAVTAFQHSGYLDPVTIRFGELFTALKDYYRHPYAPRSAQTSEAEEALMIQLFGGTIKFEREKDYVEAEDGRKVPFSVLSSGQQELLPLWLAIKSITEEKTTDQSPRILTYIEEPEAHLFPAAQGLLISHLASIVSGGRGKRKMIITTHSPYVLTKVNNLLVAGMIGGRSKMLSSKVSQIVPRASWLRPRSTRAYAIYEGKTVDIIDDDGIINGEYLDTASNELSNEFISLLELQGDQF